MKTCFKFLFLKTSSSYVTIVLYLLSYFQGKDACQGDSGGPLFAMSHKNNSNYGLRQYEIVGITSFGKDCGLNGFPGKKLFLI